MTTVTMPAQLQHQAHNLLDALVNGDITTWKRLNKAYHKIDKIVPGPSPTLADTQSLLAIEHSFYDWLRCALQQKIIAAHQEAATLRQA